MYYRDTTKSVKVSRKGNNMSNCAIVEENPDATKYAEEKYRKFLIAQTPKQALQHLWHVSELADKLSDEHVEEVLRKARKETDEGIRYEQRYLAGRWVRQFVERFALISVVLFALCGVFSIIGIVFDWPFELTFSVGYVLGALGIEGALATLILQWKQKVVSADEN